MEEIEENLKVNYSEVRRVLKLLKIKPKNKPELAIIESCVFQEHNNIRKTLIRYELKNTSCTEFEAKQKVDSFFSIIDFKTL